ncbi:transmembrane ascorbate-dependent reductase CYB561-like isoform X2 [Adelges cooleyi]|uniref:transmembrane ascorbate-dependent reductase CYB561-like isoform X2 n=1 Tax=Adelges cooleyi TaxID=133065 RepID=UPI00217FDF3D|nr:transmembrane ascorbate-dependent reductase CYB561-like isoform X2 [Adelges cooleyi]
MEFSGEPEESSIEKAVELNTVGRTNMEGAPNRLLHSAGNIGRYRSLCQLSQVFGIAILVMMFYWLNFYRGGFGFSEAKIIFNFHPMLMSIGFIYLFATSILHFRTFRNEKKNTLKYQHAIIHGFIIVLVLFGSWSAIASHLYASPPIPNFYSLHSWMGILTMLMFISQFVGGFVSFLFPGIAGEYRAAVLPYHVFIGVLTFGLAIATSILGVSEKTIFALDRKYKDLPTEALLSNSLGILIAIYGGLVVYLVTKPDYKRVPKPENGVLLTGSLE